jgi:Glyoxalase/Bleomycin resistance protein/Dioxygenase superfamily
VGAGRPLAFGGDVIDRKKLFKVEGLDRRASATREVSMVVNRSAPRATVVPVLVYEDVAKAIDWLCDTFGFTERLRAAGPGGGVSHAQLAIAEGAVMVGRPGGEFRPPRPNEVSQYVTVHV